MAATAPAAKVPWSWRDVILDREQILLSTRDLETGRHVETALSLQIDRGLREFGLRLSAGVMSKEEMDSLREEVGKIAYEAEQKLVEWAIAYVEQLWPDGPDQRDEAIDEFHVLD